MNFRGVFPILVTPFLPDESIDLNSFKTLVNFMRKMDVDGITILGVLGEANRLTDFERTSIISTTIETAGGLPVIVGTSASGKMAACSLSKTAEKLGASAVMVTPQSDPAQSNEKVVNYFEEIANSISVPIVMQDHPASSGVQMPSSLMLEMIQNIPSIACIKEEALPTAPKILHLKKNLNRDVPILTGLGALYGLFDLKAGSDGFNTGFAFPEILACLLKAKNNNNWEFANRIYQHFLPLIVFEQQPGVGIRKEVLRIRGAIKNSTVRHPGSLISQSAKSQLDDLISSTLPGINISDPLSENSIKKIIY